MKRKDVFTSITALFKRLFKKQPKEKFTYVYSHNDYPATARKVYPPDQEEIDAILDKIYERGYSRLTKVEKQKLQDASHSL